MTKPSGDEALAPAVLDHDMPREALLRKSA
jgi:hypothetical protein